MAARPGDEGREEVEDVTQILPLIRESSHTANVLFPVCGVAYHVKIARPTFYLFMGDSGCNVNCNTGLVVQFRRQGITITVHPPYHVDWGSSEEAYTPDSNAGAPRRCVGLEAPFRNG